MSQSQAHDWIAASEILPSPLLIETPEQESHDEILADWVRKIFQKGKSIDEQHRVLKKIHSHSHPDWIRLNGQDKMDELRSALYELHHRPFLEKIRVLSIAEIHKADRHFQNALLKTLEEPMPHWVILLSTDSFASVLPTIRSRCLRHKISPKENHVPFQEELEDLFSSIENKDFLKIHMLWEKKLSKRASFEEAFRHLVEQASRLRWPGHWKFLAPFVDDVFAELNRNLHQKLVWEKLWHKSLDFEDLGEI